MGIQRLQPISGGTDLLKVSPFSKIGETTDSNSWKTIFSINGKGFLDTAKIGVTIANKEVYLRITIDGVVVHSTRAIPLASPPYHATGVFRKSDLFVNGGRFETYVGRSNVQNLVQIFEYPRLNGDYSVILSRPLTFEKSLLVEVMGNLAPSYINYEIAGGVM